MSKQGNIRKILFICSGNKKRSPTAEEIYRKEKSLLVRSAGTSKKAKHEVTLEDIKWADIIFVMEKKHEQRIKANFNIPLMRKEIHVLDIPDNYVYMESELVEILKSKVNTILGLN